MKKTLTKSEGLKNPSLSFQGQQLLLFIQSMRKPLYLHNGIIGKKWLCLVLVVLMQTMLSLNMKSASGLNVPQHPGIMGDYDRIIRKADGHIDTATTISRLQNANIKTYMFLIYGPTPAMDWTDFCNEFMPAAQNAGVDVFVYLVPPSEGGSHLPYDEGNGGYTAWAEAIATQAASYSRLVGFVMDDFSPANWAYFTPLVVDEMMAAAHAICPRLSFQVIVYYSEMDDEFFFDYADHVDGIIFPYTDLDDLADLNNQIISAKEMIDHVTEHICSISYPAWTWSAPGDYGRISQTVNVTPDQSEYRISFYHSGDITYVTQGYHFKRFLIDGALVWSVDVATSGPQSGTVDLDVTSYLAGKTSATLSFELYDQQAVSNYKVRFNLQDLTATNVSVHDFSESSYWTYSENNPEFGYFNPIHGRTSLPLTVMIYASATSWHQDPPTPAYLSQAFNIASNAVEVGNADGFTTYCLDKSSITGTSYLAVKAAFFNYRDYFYRIGYWLFDEGSGSMAFDSSIFANNGTVSNASWDNSDSKFGSSLSFDRSSNSNVSVSNDASLQLTSDLTLSLWIKPAILTYRQNLLEKSYCGEYRLTVEPDGRLTYYHGSSSSNYYGLVAFPAGTIKADDTWQHIVITRDAATRTVKSYYNGIPQGTWTYPSDKLPTATTNNVWIGTGCNYAYGFTGKIDQPVIYNRALDSGEIYRQYLDSDCNGSWGFDEDYGSTAFDNSFYANNGTVSDASWDNSDSKFGSSLSFDRSSNSNVSISNDASLQLTSDLTLSLWIKPAILTYRQNLLEKSYCGEYRLTVEPDGRLTYYHGSSSSNYYGLVAFPAGTIKADDTWQHIVITRDAATRTVKSYYNGIPQGTWTYPSDKLPTATTNNVWIGIGCNYAYGFTGKIDDVKIFKRTLGSTEVISLYNSY